MSAASTSAPRVPRSKSRRHYKSYSELRDQSSLEDQNRQLRRTALAVGVGLLMICVLMGSIAYGQTQKYRELLGARLAERSELRALQASLVDAEGQIDALVRGRIPGLTRVHFDKVLPLNDRYVRNLVFTLVRSGGGVSYEYKVVVHNGTDSLAVPDFGVQVFDRFGVEIGRATVASPELNAAQALALYPDEVRSYAAAIPLPQESEPAYFRLRFH